MSQVSPTVGIFLCGDLDGPDPSLDLAAVAGSLEEALSDVAVDVVGDLCRQPGKTRELVSRSGAERVVFGVCAPKPPASEFQAWIRKSGLDPFAFELVQIRQGAGANGRSGSPGGAGSVATKVALLRLKAAVARLRALALSEPEHQRMRFLTADGGVSRRSLLFLPPLTYEAAASIDPQTCVGSMKCGLCVASCPFEAIHADGGYPGVDKRSCRGCGICVSACPVDAVELPGASLDQYAAEIETLLSAEQADLVFACRGKGTPPNADGELERLPAETLCVEVPCVGMVTPGWVLQALAGGARSVRFLPCEDGCAAGQGERIEGRIDYLHSLLETLGEDRPGERIGLSLGAARDLNGIASERADGVTLVEPAATVTALVHLAAAYGAPADVSLDHGSSALGVVEVRSETCTLCGACPAACPTDALTIAEREGEVVLSFDAANCIACRRCEAACPEAATNTLTVFARTDLAAVAAGPTDLKSGAVARCTRCGRSIASAPMLARVGKLLEQEEGYEKLVESLRDLCADCRGAGGPSF